MVGTCGTDWGTLVVVALQTRTWGKVNSNVSYCFAWVSKNWFKLMYFILLQWFIIKLNYHDKGIQPIHLNIYHVMTWDYKCFLWFALCWLLYQYWPFSSLHYNSESQQIYFESVTIDNWEYNIDFILVLLTDEMNG